jgi:polyisoprenoid-binding protein YceI
MALRILLPSTPFAILLAAAAMGAVTTAQAPRAALAIDSARVTIAGASNVHAWTAATTTVRITRVMVGATAQTGGFWDEVVKPGALEAFELAIPAASLASGKEGLDKNMHKALKVQEHADIIFRLLRLESGAAANALKAVGILRIAGVEREVTLDLKAERRDALLVIKGELPLLMTDYGIKPPTAMLGMLKTDPKVTVAFETILAVPLT